MTILYVNAQNDFKKIEYPKDIEYTLSNTMKVFKTYEYSDVFYVIKNKKIEYRRRDTLNIATIDSNTLLNSRYYLTLNESFYFPIENSALYNKINLPKNLTKIYDFPHPVNYIGYQYEGHSIKSRKLIDSLKLRMKIFIHEPK